ncbi:MAG: hypothetical protein KBD37_07835 [Burkholderiales bacterium]|nr:hypothetical protein [Burkholderiales bacterium]
MAFGETFSKNITFAVRCCEFQKFLRFTHGSPISGLGFKFSGAKKCWYWSPTIDTNIFKRGSKSMKNIRKEYGSQIIEIAEQVVIH